MTYDRLEGLRAVLRVDDPERVIASLEIIRKDLEELLIVQRRDEEVAALLVEQLARPEIRANLPRLTLLLSAADEVRLGASRTRLSLGQALLVVAIELDPMEERVADHIRFALSAATRLVGVHVLSDVVRLLDDRYSSEVHLIALANALRALEPTPSFTGVESLVGLRAATRKILEAALARRTGVPIDATLAVAAAQVLCLCNCCDLASLVTELKEKGNTALVASFLNGMLRASVRWRDQMGSMNQDLTRFHVLVTEALAELTKTG